MKLLFVVVLIIVIVILIFVGLAVGFSYIMGFTISIKDWVKYLEKFLGKYKILKNYSVLEYNYRGLHPDQPCKLLLQLSESNYKEVLELISNPDYANKLFDKNDPLRGLWCVSSEEFYLNTDALEDYDKGSLKLGISGNNNDKTILLTSIHFV